MTEKKELACPFIIRWRSRKFPCYVATMAILMVVMVVRVCVFSVVIVGVQITSFATEVTSKMDRRMVHTFY